MSNHDRTDAGPRPFRLIRDVDVSGISGTGVIAEGVQFSDGAVALRWRGEWPSWNIHDRGLDAVQHVHGHNGSTRIEWLDGVELAIAADRLAAAAGDIAASPEYQVAVIRLRQMAGDGLPVRDLQLALAEYDSTGVAHALADLVHGLIGGPRDAGRTVPAAAVATDAPNVEEVRVIDLYAECSFPQTPHCRRNATSAVVDPGNGNRYFRCEGHRGQLSPGKYGDVSETVRRPVRS